MEVAVADEICARCQKFDFKVMFDSEDGILASTGRPIKPNIENLTDVTVLAPCSLCRLSASLRGSADASLRSGNTFHLRAWSSTALSGIILDKDCQNETTSMVLSLELGKGTKAWRKSLKSWS